MHSAGVQSSPVITLNSVSKSFTNLDGTELKVLEDLSLQLNEGEILSILGRSGVGKTTVLNLIAGIIAPSNGKLQVLGNAPKVSRHKLSYLEQRPQLLSFRTAFQNACLGLELRNELSEESLRTLRGLFQTLNLEDSSDFYPNQLSGGMQQRVAFARTFCVSTPILLCDEPLASQDFETRIELESLFWKLVKKRGKSAIIVTHDIESAISVSDRVMVLAGKPGKLVYVLDIEEELKMIDPQKCRKSALFPKYFSALWAALRFENGV